MNTASVWIGIVVFACGSYALRASGVLLRARVKLSGFAEKTLDRAVVVLLLAVVVTSTVFTGHDVAGPGQNGSKRDDYRDLRGDHVRAAR